MLAKSLSQRPSCSARDLVASATAACARTALHERVLMVFHGYLFTRTLLSPQSAERASLRLSTLLLLLTTLAAVALRQRSERDARRPLGARALAERVLVRAGVVLPLLGGYLAMRTLLPSLGVPLADTRLLALDYALLGTTPALWLQRYASVAVTEWMAFFYYGYYALLAIHVLLALPLTATRQSRELLVGLTLVTTVGHALYTLVPGVGPIGFAGVAFEAPLAGGYFFERVQHAVVHAGAQFDIFPSLHTAHPLLIALHALRHRRAAVYRYTWFLVVVAAAHMVLATVFLRFHYGVDVLAGIALAAGAHALSILHARQRR